MGRMVKRLTGLEIDEVSLVDIPANQHGLVAIAKNHLEDHMSVFDAEGNEVFQEDLEDMAGQFVYNEAGDQFLVGDPDEDEGGFVQEDERELAGVGKGFTPKAALAGQLTPQNIKRAKQGAALGAAGAGGFAAGRMSKSLGTTVLEELSKALTDQDRDAVIAKALDQVEAVAKRNADLEQEVASLREDREREGFQAIAKSYELGEEDAIAGLLHRAAAVLPAEDLNLLDRVFTTTGQVAKQFMGEVGVSGAYGQESDTLSQVYDLASQAISKNAELGLTQEAAVTAIFSANPDAYDAYEAEQRFNR